MVTEYRRLLLRLGCSVGRFPERGAIAVFKGLWSFQRSLHRENKHPLIVELHCAGLAQARVKIKQLGVARSEPAEMPLFDQFFREVAANLLVVHRAGLFSF